MERRNFLRSFGILPAAALPKVSIPETSTGLDRFIQDCNSHVGDSIHVGPWEVVWTGWKAAIDGNDRACQILIALADNSGPFETFPYYALSMPGYCTLLARGMAINITAHNFQHCWGADARKWVSAEGSATYWEAGQRMLSRVALDAMYGALSFKDNGKSIRWFDRWSDVWDERRLSWQSRFYLELGEYAERKGESEVARRERLQPIYEKAYGGKLA